MEKKGTHALEVGTKADETKASQDQTKNWRVVTAEADLYPTGGPNLFIYWMYYPISIKCSGHLESQAIRFLETPLKEEYWRRE